MAERKGMGLQDRVPICSKTANKDPCIAPNKPSNQVYSLASLPWGQEWKQQTVGD